MKKFDLEMESLKVCEDIDIAFMHRHKIQNLCKQYALSLIEDVDLWLEISKYCHNNTENCPHDIGIKIAEIIKSKINKE